MSKKETPLDNPFKNLDKSQYRDARDPQRRAQERIRKAAKTPASSVADNDEDLFAALMSWQGVAKLERNKKAAKSATTADKTTSEPSGETTPAPIPEPEPEPRELVGTKLEGSIAHAQSRKEEPEQTQLSLGEHSAFALLKTQIRDLPQQHEKPVQMKPAPAEQTTAAKKSAPAQPGQNTPDLPPRPGHTPLPESWQDEAEYAETDEGIFTQAMAGVQNLNGSGRAVPLLPPAPKPALKPKPVHPLQDFLDGKIEFSLEYTEEYLEGHVKGLDSQVINKMKAGAYSFEAHMDLHGLNAAQAWEALVGFFRSSYHKGHRCVLVVPGRGLNSPGGTGILRERLQTWFTKEPFKYVILAFSTALPKHGGAGALYVLLRKQKKSRGKIAWDIIPPDADLLD